MIARADHEIKGLICKISKHLNPSVLYNMHVVLTSSVLTVFTTVAGKSGSIKAILSSFSKILAGDQVIYSQGDLSFLASFYADKRFACINLLTFGNKY